MSKRDFSTTICDNPTPARYSQGLLGRRVEPVSCGSFIGSEVGGVLEYATDVGGVEAKRREPGWLDLEEGHLFSPRAVSATEDDSYYGPHYSRCVSRRVEAKITS